MNITLATLVDAGNAQVALEEYITNLEVNLKAKNEALRKLSQETLPNMMAEIGLESFTLPGGYTVTIDNKVYAKLPEDTFAAFEWLRENNMDGIIKTQLFIDFGKGEDTRLQEIQDLLVEAGVCPTVKSTIHHMTLKATVREQIEKGTGIPLDDFGAGTIRTSVIKK